MGVLDMLSGFRPSFEVVREGRILKKLIDDHNNYKISVQDEISCDAETSVALN